MLITKKSHNKKKKDALSFYHVKPKSKIYIDESSQRFYSFEQICSVFALKHLNDLSENTFVPSIGMPVAEMRLPDPFIALSAFTRPRSSKPTWRRNATRTTIISIWTPTSPCNRSSMIMQSHYSPSPRRTPAWIFTYCRYVTTLCKRTRLSCRKVDIVSR